MAKTYKREVALLVLGYLGYLGLYGRTEVVDVMVWPLMLYVGAAFGMDWARSQLNEVSKDSISFNPSTWLQSDGPSKERADVKHKRSTRTAEQPSVRDEYIEG